MMNKEFIEALDELEKSKGISKDVIFDALETALVSSFRKNFQSEQDVFVDINRETGDIKLYSQKTVVDEVEDDVNEISLEDAKKINSKYQVGDTVNFEEAPKEYGRIAAQTAKQVVIQKIKDAEREKIHDEFIVRQGEIITGQIQRISNKNIFIDMGKVEGIIPPNEQIPNEVYKMGDRLKLVISEIRKTNKGPQIVLSRSKALLVRRLFELEVPEITEGLIDIYSIAREAGSRSKIAVYAKDDSIDPLGACVGQKGQRVNSIVEELNGEKIDIIIYNENPEIFIKNALSPADVVSCEINEEEKSAIAVVPNSQISLAIGKQGQNVRLAAKLTTWKIDIHPEDPSTFTGPTSEPYYDADNQEILNDSLIDLFRNDEE